MWCESENFSNPDDNFGEPYPSLIPIGLPPATYLNVKLRDELYTQLRRWMTIQSGMHRYYRHPRYHTIMRIVHAELDRLEKEMESHGFPCCYKEGERTRSVLLIPGSPQHDEWIIENRSRMEKQLRCWRGPILSPVSFTARAGIDAPRSPLRLQIEDIPDVCLLCHRWRHVRPYRRIQHVYCRDRKRSLWVWKIATK